MGVDTTMITVPRDVARSINRVRKAGWGQVIIHFKDGVEERVECNIGTKIKPSKENKS